MGLLPCYIAAKLSQSTLSILNERWGSILSPHEETEAQSTKYPNVTLVARTGWDENPVSQPQSLCAKPLYSSAPEKTTHWTCVESTFKTQTLKEADIQHSRATEGISSPAYPATLFLKDPSHWPCPAVCPRPSALALCPPAFPRERPHLPSVRDTGMVGSYIREVSTGLIQLWAWTWTTLLALCWWLGTSWTEGSFEDLHIECPL